MYLTIKFLSALLRRFIYFMFFCLSVTIVYGQGQDAQFSQFYANPLYLGPSFAGAVEGSRITGQYRTQWVELGVPFKTYSASYDHYFSSFNSGVGINFISDVAGSTKLGITTIGLHYSYNFQIFNIWHVRPGLSFSYIEAGMFGDIIAIDQILDDGSTNTSAAPSGLDNKDIDAGTSLLIYTKGFWLGTTVDHMLEPNVSLYSDEAIIPTKLSVYGGIDFRRRGKLLKPSDDIMTFAFLYKQQNLTKQLDLGVYWYNHPIILGLWYRGIPIVNSDFGDAVVFLAGIKTKNFNIGYSYDFTISSLLPHTRGSHEISLTTKFLLPKRDKRGAVPCPEF